MDPAQYGGGDRLSGAAFWSPSVMSGCVAYSLGAHVGDEARRDKAESGATGR
jgi:hypothetical protein